MKYIMLKTQMSGKYWRYEPFVFSKFLTHAYVAETAIAMLKQRSHDDYVVHSAGFYEDSTCHGHSSSLQVGHDPRDTERIRTANKGEMILD